MPQLYLNSMLYLTLAVASSVAWCMNGLIFLHLSYRMLLSVSGEKLPDPPVVTFLLSRSLSRAQGFNYK